MTNTDIDPTAVGPRPGAYMNEAKTRYMMPVAAGWGCYELVKIDGGYQGQLVTVLVTEIGARRWVESSKPAM